MGRAEKLSPLNPTLKSSPMRGKLAKRATLDRPFKIGRVSALFAPNDFRRKSGRVRSFARSPPTAGAHSLSNE